MGERTDDETERARGDATGVLRGKTLDGTRFRGTEAGLVRFHYRLLGDDVGRMSLSSPAQLWPSHQGSAERVWRATSLPGKSPLSCKARAKLRFAASAFFIRYSAIPRWN